MAAPIASRIRLPTDYGLSEDSPLLAWSVVNALLAYTRPVKRQCCHGPVRGNDGESRTATPARCPELKRDVEAFSAKVERHLARMGATP